MIQLLIFAIVACTGSMTPEFTCNQTITLTPEFEFTHGDVYVYNNTHTKHPNDENHMIIHRLAWYTRFEAIFKADNALYYERVPIGDVMYKVVEDEEN